MEGIRIERRGATLELTIDRPKANAIDSATSQAMGEAFIAFRDDPELRVAIVTGAGDRFFSAGWDLKAYAAGDPGDPEAFGAGGLAGLTELFDLDKPVIAAVNGYAAGGGFELALACDLIVADARCPLLAARGEARAWSPTPAGSSACSRRMPRALAMELLLTGKPIDAAEAARWGIVNRVVERERLLDEARALAAEIEAAAPLATRAVKAIARRDRADDRRGGVRRAARRQHPGVRPRDGVGRRRGGRRGRSPRAASRSGAANERRPRPGRQPGQGRARHRRRHRDRPGDGARLRRVPGPGSRSAAAAPEPLEEARARARGRRRRVPGGARATSASPSRCGRWSTRRSSASAPSTCSSTTPAGSSPPPAEEITAKGMRAVHRLTLDAAWELTREVATRSMIPGGGGLIVFGGFSPRRGIPGFAHAAAARAALENLAQGLALEWSRHSVRSVCVVLGNIDTEGSGRLRRRRRSRRRGGRFRWAGSAGPRRWGRRSRSSPPRAAPTSPARASSSTAASTPGARASRRRNRSRRGITRATSSNNSRATSSALA